MNDILLHTTIVARGLASEHEIERARATNPGLGITEALVKAGIFGHDDLERLAREAEGARTVGPYRLIKLLGRGGMGEIYLAVQAALGRRVALKLLPPGFGDEPDIVERFRREAQIIARLSHPHVCPIIDAGEDAGVHYYAMEYLAGRDLREVMDQQRMDYLRAARIGRQAAEALHFAHENGVLHRDVTPRNIVLTRSARRVAQTLAPVTGGSRWLGRLLGRDRDTRVVERADVEAGPIDADREKGPSPEFEDHVYLIDFGLARETGAARLTVTGDVLGTPHYLSPEQAAGRKDLLGPPTDVYGLGATLYHLIAGRPIFSGENASEVLLKVLQAEPVAPRRIRRDIPRDLETIVLKCVEKEPARRYATARDLADDLRRFMSDEPIAARPASMVYRFAKRVRRHRGVAAALAAGVLAVVAVVVAFTVPDALDARRRRLHDESRVREANAMLERGQTLELEAEFERDFPRLKVPLAESAMLRARSLDDGPDRRVALARAYGYGRAGARRDIAADALFELAGGLVRDGDVEPAIGALDSFLRQFPNDSRVRRVHALRAQALVAMGDVEAATASLEFADGPVADDVRAFLARMTPIGFIDVPVLAFAVGDLDDGGPSVAALDADGALRIVRVKSAEPIASGQVGGEVGYAPDLEIADVDGDGRPELVVGGGANNRTAGWVEIWRLDAGELTRLDVVVVRGLHSLRAADLDGDGAAEIVVGYRSVERAVDVISRKPGGFELRGAWEVGSDIVGIEPLGEGRVAFAVGPWRVETGYRIVCAKFDLERRRFVTIGESEVRAKWDHLARVPCAAGCGEGDCVLADLSAEPSIETLLEASGFRRPAGRLVRFHMAPDGSVREAAPLRAVAGSPRAMRGRPANVILVGDTLRSTFHSPGGARFTVPGHPSMKGEAWATDTHLFFAVSASRILVFGPDALELPRWRPARPAEEATFGEQPIADVPEAVARELYQWKLHDATADLCRRRLKASPSDVRFLGLLARAEVEAGRLDEAAETMRRTAEIDAGAFSELVPDYIEVMTALREYEALERTLRDFSRRYRASAALRRRIDETLSWLADVNGLREVWSLADAERTPFVCDNPLMVKWDGKALDVRHDGAELGFVGFLIGYDGGSFRIDQTVRAHRMDWGARGPLAALSPWPPRRDAEQTIGLKAELGRSGATDFPTTFFEARPVRLPPGAAARMVLTWPRGWGRLDLRLEPEGEPPCTVERIEPHAPPAGTYVLGQMVNRIDAGSNVDHAGYKAHWTVERWSLLSPGDAVTIAEVEPIDTWELFLAANGHAVFGRMEQAETGWKATLDEIEADIRRYGVREGEIREPDDLRSIRVRVHLFRGILTESPLDFRRAFELDREWAAHTLARSTPGLTTEQRAWVRGQIGDAPRDAIRSYGTTFADLLLDDSEIRVDHLKDEAEKFRAQGGFDEAEAMLEEALEIFPGHRVLEHRLWIVRAERGIAEGRWQEASAAVDEAEARADDGAQRAAVERLRRRLAPYVTDF